MLASVASGWETLVPTSIDESFMADASESPVIALSSSTRDGFVSYRESGQAHLNFSVPPTNDRAYIEREPLRKVSTAETNAARYGELIDNEWQSPLQEPLSTFSIDVDTASMSNVRGLIANGATRDQIPRDSVRIEELVNYFDWDYPNPTGEHPFTFAAETAECPWNRDHRIMRVGVQVKEVQRNKRPDTNLVFLLDVSGSMNRPNKLLLVKQAISVLIEELNENDRVSIVVYARSQGLALPTISGADQAAITAALDRLDAGGSINGGADIKLAYKMAQEKFIDGGVNRVILCTDGDFNVGITKDEDLVSLVEKKAESGVFLSVCGFGNDNLNDAMLEEITNRGNGNYFYIDTFNEARKVFLQDMMGTLVTIAKDVKIQVEFNLGKVAAYRLIGYANCRLEAEDFENDEIDASEVGAGHSVTALYEVVPVGADENPALFAAVISTHAAEKPNFVFIVSEDNSKHYLKLFDEDGAETPHIADLAENGIKFTEHSPTHPSVPRRLLLSRPAATALASTRNTTGARPWPPCPKASACFGPTCATSVTTLHHEPVQEGLQRHRIRGHLGCFLFQSHLARPP